MLEQLRNRFYQYRRDQRLVQQITPYLGDIKIHKDDIVIDCGANVGDAARAFARMGATVHAFEPNPHIYTRLVERCRDMRRIKCYNQAIYDHNDTMRLYLDERFVTDNTRSATASSLFSEKSNVSKSDFVDVQVISLAEFIGSLPNRIRIIKMDIEGAEYATLTSLIKSGIIQRVDHLLVEGHHEQVPELRDQYQSLLDLMEEQHIDNIAFTWP